MITEKLVRMTSQMYEMRDLLRRIDGANYARNIQGWKDLVADVAKAQEVSELDAVLLIVKSMKDRNEYSESIFMRLTVAAVELVEPSGAELVESSEVPKPVTSEMPTVRRVPDVGLVLDRVAKRMGVRMSDMLGDGRPAPVCDARAVAVSVLRFLTPMSFPEIARAMRYGSHSSAIAAVLKVNRSAQLLAARLDVVDQLSNELVQKTGGQ